MQDGFAELMLCAAFITMSCYRSGLFKGSNMPHYNGLQDRHKDNYVMENSSGVVAKIS